MTLRARDAALVTGLLAACATSNDLPTTELDAGGGTVLPDASTEPSTGDAAGAPDVHDRDATVRICSDDDFCHGAVPAGTHFLDVWGDGTGVLWAVTKEKSVLRWDGTTWKVHYQASSPVTRIWGNSPTDLWVVSDDGVLHGTGETSAQISFSPTGFMPGDAKGPIRAVWGAAATDVWALGGNDSTAPQPTGRVLHRFDDPDLGFAWQLVPELSSLDVSFRGMGGTAETGIWVHGVSRNPPYGSAPRLFRQVPGATEWTEIVLPSAGLPTAELVSFWVAPDDSAWLAERGVGGISRVLRGMSADGGATYTWTVEEVDPMRGVNAIWANGRDDAWVAGDSGLVRHWDGSTWSQAAIRVTDFIVTNELRAMWGTSNDDFWIVGDEISLHRTRAGKP